LAPITIIEWDFGDGATSTDESPTHIYETDGIFDVVLHVENEYGCSDTKTRTIYIADLNPDFTIGDGCVGESMSFFNASAPEGLIVIDSYDWNFGDGSTSLVEDPTHTYVGDGPFDVEFIVSSPSGCKDTIVKSISPNPLPDVNFQALFAGVVGTTGCVYEPVSFEDLTVIDPPSEIVSWSWDFGDGGTFVGTDPTHEYSASGTYTVTLTLTSSFGCVGTGTLEITMTDGMDVVSPDTTICQNGVATVYVNSSDGSPHDYTWSIPDADSGNTQTVPSTDAPMMIYVFATDAAGCVSPTDSMYVDVLPPLDLSLSIPSQTCRGAEMEGEATVSGGNGVYTYTWTANGTPLPDNTPIITHTPFTTTEYCVTVNDGCETTPLTLCGTTLVPLVPSFTSDKTYGCIGTAVEFTSLSEPIDSIVEIVWEIEDVTYTGSTAAHVFEEEGEYDITINVRTNDGCWTSFTASDYITIYGLPSPEFYITPNPATVLNTTVELVNISPNPSSDFEWRIPSGSPNYSTSDSLVEVNYPPAVNNHLVTMTETTQYGCIDSTSLYVYIEREHLLFAPNTFTPDGDGINNTWRVYMDGLDIYDYHLMLFNRYGELIWESYDTNAAWNGRYGNQGIVQDGTYVWIIDARDLSTDKRFRFEGTVNVLR
jgi:gliding motility-associated-like protein